MKILSRARTLDAAHDGITATARAERDSEKLSHKLKKGQIAVVDRTDLDRAFAESLIDRGVRAVVNASQSISGRYPTMGPQMLAQAGITIIDDVGHSIFSKFKSGDQFCLEGGNVLRAGVLIATGTELTDERIAALTNSAESRLSTRLESLSVNAAEHLRRERTMLLEGDGIPRLRTDLRNRPALVVSKTHDFAADLKALAHYINDYNPVLIGAGAGADALMEAGRMPDVVVGELANISDRALKTCREVVITSASSKVTSVERLEKAGCDAVTFIGTGSDEDLALIVADANDASVIVLAGGHNDLIGFLDRGPTDMASTFLARLKIGNKLVDAKSVAEFYNHKISFWPIALLAIVGIVAVAVAIAATPVGELWFEALPGLADDVVIWIKGLFS